MRWTRWAVVNKSRGWAGPSRHQSDEKAKCPRRVCWEREEAAGMVLLTTKMVQRVSLFVAFGGLVTTFITTFLPLWKTMNSELNEMENWYEGLWHTCIFTEEVGLQCKAFESLLSLPPVTLVSRIFMCVSIACGFFGVSAAFFGLEGVEIGAGGAKSKRRLLILGGVLILVSGTTTLAPVSLLAYVMVVEFWDAGLPDVMPRWEYGEAMFSAWFSGLLLVLGGSFLFVAVCMGDRRARRRRETSRHGLDTPPRRTLGTQNYLKTAILWTIVYSIVAIEIPNKHRRVFRIYREYQSLNAMKRFTYNG